MSTVKRVSGEYTIQSIGASDPINLISPSVNIDGNLTVTGNAVLVGNINADKIFNGTTSIEIPVTGGNANVTVGGTANVAVFATTGAFITGLASVHWQRIKVATTHSRSSYRPLETLQEPISMFLATY
jgi:hypothetical protein